MTHAPFHVEGEDRPSRWLVTCDHATNAVPDAIGGGTLGLAPEDMARHIAFDPGALGVARALGRLLDGRVIWTDFSRLVIDPNRGEDDPTLVMRLYDGTVIPGNRRVDAAEVERRKSLCYRPYHAAYEALAARVPDTVVVAVHSFTPQLQGRPPRPWSVGILYASDARLSRPLIDRLRAAEPQIEIGENEPYSGHLPGDAIWRHALAHGRQNTLIEVRNDLIRDAAGQEAWARRIAPHLPAALADAEIAEREGTP